jgi:hypothetical protein
VAATPVAGILGVDGVVSVRAVPLGDSLPLVRPEGWPAENVQDHSHRPHRHVVPASTEIIFAGQWHPRADGGGVEPERRSGGHVSFLVPVADGERLAEHIVQGSGAHRPHVPGADRGDLGS